MKWYLQPQDVEFSEWDESVISAFLPTVSLPKNEPDAALPLGESTLFPLTDTPPTLDADHIVDTRTIVVSNDTATANYTIGVKSDEQKAIEKKALVPAFISSSQLRIGLLDDGLLATAEAIIAGIPDTATQIRVDTFWKHSAEFQREHPYIGLIGAQLGLDDDAIDKKFIAYKLI